MRIKNYKQFITETTKFNNKSGDNFNKLVNRVLTKFKETDQTIIKDFTDKLFDYLSSDESNKFKINLFDTKYKRLVDIIHELDALNAEILLQRNKKKNVKVEISEIPTVWKDEVNKIYVYHARTIFDAIELGKRTNFCISSDYTNGKNYFYSYLYGIEGNIFQLDNPMKQKSTIFFVKSLNQKPEYQTLAIDVQTKRSFLYTDVRNKDKKYSSYKEMIQDDYTSTDLNIIPKEVFKFIEHIPNEFELEAEPLLLLRGKYTKDYIKNKIKNVKLNDKNIRSIIVVCIKKLGDNADLNFLDVSNVTNMNYLFSGCYRFKGDISKWDVSNVTKMVSMFEHCYMFNRDISKWNISSVTNMESMLNGCKSFNQDLSKWDVSNVTNMAGMFYRCVSFNQDLSKWDVSNVINMGGLFNNCKSFNQDLSKWDIRDIVNTTDMFLNCNSLTKIPEWYKGEV